MIVDLKLLFTTMHITNSLMIYSHVHLRNHVGGGGANSLDTTNFAKLCTFYQFGEHFSVNQHKEKFAILLVSRAFVHPP